MGIPVVLRVQAEKDSSVNKVLNEVKRDVKDLGTGTGLENLGVPTSRLQELNTKLEESKKLHKGLTGEVEGLARGFGLAATAAGAGMAVILGNSVRISSEFEQLRARLETVVGSAGRAQTILESAKQRAASTPFDVRGIVEATVQLEVYGQRSEEVLPLVADLAAGMGRDIKETSLVVGKALSGSLEGFESLRNTYGVSSAELAKFGAQLTATGGISVKTSEDLLKAQDALQRIIRTRFGGAVERQSKTLQGSLSNAGDSVTNLAGKLGDDLAPAVQIAAGLFTRFVEKVSGLPDPIRQIGSVSAVAATGVLLLGGGATTATVGLVAMNRQLAVAAAAGLPAAAAGAAATGRALTVLGGAASTAAGVVGILTTTVAGPLVAALIAANIAVANYRREQEQVAQALDQQSQSVQGSRANLRALTDVVNDLAREQGHFVERTGDASKFARQFGEALDSIPAGQLADRLVRLGFTVEELGKRFQINRGAANTLRGQILELSEAIKEGEKINGLVNIEDGLQSFFEGRDLVSLDEARDARERLLQDYKDLGQEAEALSQAQDKIAAISPELKAIVDESGRLKDFLGFSSQTASVDNLVTSLKKVDEQIQANNKRLAADSLPTTFEGLQQELLKSGEELRAGRRAAVEAQLDLFRQREQLQTKVTEKTKQLNADEVKALELNLRQQKALRDVSAKEEIQALEQQLAKAKELGEAGLSQQVDIQSKIKAVRERQAKEAGDAAKKVVEAQLSSATKSLTEVSSQQGVTAGQVKDRIDLVLSALSQWRERNQQLLKDFPELKTKFEGFVQGLTTQRGQRATAELSENFRSLKDQIAGLSVDAISASQRLEAVGRAIALTKSAQAAGSIKTADGDRLLTDLSRQRLQLERQIANEKRAQADEIAAIQIEAIQQEISALEERREAGQAVEGLLIAKREELLKARLDAIDREKVAELAANKDREFVEQKAALKREALLKAETQRRRKEYQAREKDHADSLGREEQAEGVSQSRRAGPTPTPQAAAPDSRGQTTTDPRQSAEQAFSGQGSQAATAAFRASQEKAEREREERRRKFREANPLGTELVDRIDQSRAADIGRRDAERAKQNEARFKGRLNDLLDRAGVKGVREAVASATPTPPTFSAVGRTQLQGTPTRGKASAPVPTPGNPQAQVTNNYNTYFSPNVTMSANRKQLVNAVAEDLVQEIEKDETRRGPAGELGS